MKTVTPTIAADTPQKKRYPYRQLSSGMFNGLSVLKFIP
jgi:hypothetical protein